MKVMQASSGRKRYFFRRLLVRAAAVLAGLLICLAGLEAGLRLLGRGWLAGRNLRNASSAAGRADYRIVCFGESMTINVYPRLLERGLCERFPGVRFSVIDKGMSSSDSDYIVSVIDESLARYRPDMVIVMTGINDSKDPVLYSDYLRGRKLSFFRRLRLYRLWRFLRMDLERAANGEDGRGNGGQGDVLENCLRRIERLADEGELDEAFSVFETEYLPRAGVGDIAGNYGVIVDKLLVLCNRQDMVEKLMRRVLAQRAHDIGANNYLAYSLIMQNRHDEAMAYFRRRIEEDGFFFCYTMLALVCRSAGDEREEEKVLLEGMRRTGSSDFSYSLLDLYWRQERFADCERMLIRIRDNDGIRGMDWFCGAMAACLRAQSREDEACEYELRLRDYGARFVHPKTADNLDRIAHAVLSGGARLVCMQYPMRSVAPLRKMLAAFGDEVFFVDNEAVFKQAVAMHGRRAVFSDSFGGDFGHLADKGREILVSNMVSQLAAGPLLGFDEAAARN